MLSSTVTVEGQVAELLLGSWMNTGTVLGPKSAQVKVTESRPFARTVSKPQLSKLPGSARAVAATVTVPAAFNETVGLLHTAIGLTLSVTLTVTAQVPTLPLESVTVRTVVFDPTSEQLKVDWLKVMLSIAQLSLLLLLTAATVVETVAPTKNKLMGPATQLATGATVSTTVICEVQES